MSGLGEGSAHERQEALWSRASHLSPHGTTGELLREPSPGPLPDEFCALSRGRAQESGFSKAPRGGAARVRTEGREDTGKAGDGPGPPECLRLEGMPACEWGRGARHRLGGPFPRPHPQWNFLCAGHSPLSPSCSVLPGCELGSIGKELGVSEPKTVGRQTNPRAQVLQPISQAGGWSSWSRECASGWRHQHLFQAALVTQSPEQGGHSLPELFPTEVTSGTSGCLSFNAD